MLRNALLIVAALALASPGARAAQASAAPDANAGKAASKKAAPTSTAKDDKSTKAPAPVVAAPPQAPAAVNLLQGLDLTTDAKPTAAGSGALGLDLSADKPTRAKPAMGLDLTADEDWEKGPVVVAVPPRRADGKPDLSSYKWIHAVLKDKLGARLVAEDATLKAIDQEKLRGQALATSEGLAKLAAAVKAERLIVTAFQGAKLEVQVLEKPSSPPATEIAFTWTKRTDKAQVRGWMNEVLKASREVLGPPAVPTFVPAPAPTQNVAQEGLGDVGEEASREGGRRVRREVGKGPMGPPLGYVLVGGGTTLRSFTARTTSPIVPQAQGSMPGMGFDVTLYPLRMIPAIAQLAGGKVADFSLEGHYRRTFAQASIKGGDFDGATCKVDDDEIVARAAWRYPIGGMWPHIGASAAWVSERALMKCESPTLSTRYRSTEVHLKLLQPLLGEQLQLELAGGPRFVFSKHAAGYADRAFSAEGWLMARPHDNFFMRGGARWTNTRLRTYPEGVPVTDIRWFVGLELGASI
ncbi:MAG: hypothetical protein HY901_16615 [Deltaproteobacteria bacterium]|nr:hypothetical protein [Deltaproteobacteria bacterium]